MKKILFKLILVFLGSMPSYVFALSPSLFAGYDVESMTVRATIPVPGSPETVELKPLLIKPKTSAPWSAIVLPSNCSGAEDRLWHFWVPQLVANNIAVVLLDSFKPRGFDSICGNQFKITLAARLQDAHQVLDYLRKDSRFAPEKIAIGGHSSGAWTTFLSSFKEVQKHLERGADGSYNAFVAAGASCEFSFKEPALSGPLLIIAGEKDDWTLPEPCRKEVERIASASQNASFAQIDGAYHTFSTSGVVYNNRVMKMPVGIPQMYLNKLSYVPKETTAEMATGEVLPVDKILRNYSGFMGSKLFGASLGGDWDKAPEVARLTVEFLKKYGW